MLGPSPPCRDSLAICYSSFPFGFSAASKATQTKSVAYCQIIPTWRCRTKRSIFYSTRLPDISSHFSMAYTQLAYLKYGLAVVPSGQGCCWHFSTSHTLSANGRIAWKVVKKFNITILKLN